MTEPLSQAVHDYVWAENASIPGRHPERVPDSHLRDRAQAIIADLDRIQPGDDAVDLFAWADQQVRTLAAQHTGLDERAIEDLRALLSWTWR